MSAKKWSPQILRVKVIVQCLQCNHCRRLGVGKLVTQRVPSLTALEDYIHSTVSYATVQSQMNF